jgi:tripartite-type tricarboxylate transporter receptor subunit TctC
MPMTITAKFSVFSVVAALAAISAPALSQAFPSKPVRLVVGSAAGGPIDLVARITAQKLAQALDQQIVVENRVGAGGTIAADYVAKSPRDGYTLSMGSAATLCIAPALYPKLPYDPIRDFAPVSVVASTSFVFVVHPSIPASSVEQFIAIAKARPGQLRFGSGGSGSVTHLSVELFRSMAGIAVLHVPYRGGSLAIIDLLSGHIDFMFDSIPNSQQHVKTGKLRALGVTSATRSHRIPEVPTIAEAGVPGYEATTWFGVLAPAETPPDVIERLAAALRQAAASDDLRQRMLGHGFEPLGNTPQQFARLIRLELPKWAKVVQSSGARAD